MRMMRVRQRGPRKMFLKESDSETELIDLEELTLEALPDTSQPRIGELGGIEPRAF